MSIMRWEPFGLARMRQEMDRMFDEFFRGMTPAETGTRAPALDMSETDQDVKLTAELPGVDKDHLTVEVLPEAVSIKGEVRREEERKGEGWVRRERQYQSFERTVPLPAEVKPDEAKATFRDGLLQITLPKSEQAKRKQPVKVSVEAA